MVECQQCQRDVVRAFAIWEKEKRRWMDLDQDVLVGSGFGERVQQMTARWSTTIEGRVGLRTLNERINQIEPLAHCAHRQWLDALPPVFQVDGMWVTIHR